MWSEYVGARWGQINVRHAGRSGPALMLFHESPLSSEVFSQSLPHLGRRLRVSAFDTPGYGASDPPPEPAGVGNMRRRSSRRSTKPIRAHLWP